MERGFKGIWIPSEIWLDNRLTALDKMILAEISSLDTGDGCYASNKYLADFCGSKENTISISISKLKDLRYIEQVSFDGRQRILKSCLIKNQRQTLKKSKADYEKVKGLHYKNNIVDYSNRECRKTTHFIPPKVDEVKAYCEERKNGIDPQRFIDYYEARGWMIGKNKMKDWKAAVRTWERNDSTPKSEEKELSPLDEELLRKWGGG